ncbi:MAG: alkaline phosphatase family protein [Myxococcales bacterium]|nr:alkaline phosphatase family protein [Polyangiaceae bacterium]MDW8249383.1 alkaline phosphatase family protein [Myxococcales bacterium]
MHSRKQTGSRAVLAAGWIGLAWVGACASTLPPLEAPPPALPEPLPPASSAAPIASVASQPERPKVPVVVALVVDQLGAWVAQERLPKLPNTGGFARLRAEGTWVVDARHPYAATDTAPGHSMLFTGATPAESGIFANEVPEGTERVSILQDARVRLVGSRGPLDKAGSSLVKLRVDTLADRLKAARPDSFVVGVSIKDRGALFGCGRRADGCLWFDTGLDGFVTSTFYGEQFPEWAKEAGSPEATSAARQAPWELLDPNWVKAHSRTPDDQPGEGDWGGLGRTFPHIFQKAKSPSSSFRASPVADELVLALAAAAARHQLAGKVPTLLVISLSSNDYVGHVFGTDSWEAWDNLLRLDRALAAFFQVLDKQWGPAGYAVVLSADHGATPLPETHDLPGARPWCQQAEDRWNRVCSKGGRLSVDGMARELEEAAVKALGKGKWVLNLADPYVFLTPAARELPPARRKKLHEALEVAAKKNPCVDRLVDVRQRPEVCPPRSNESMEALLCRSMPQQADLEFYVLLRPGCFFDSDYVPGYGTSHGTPYLYDRAVPVLVKAPGWVKPGRVLEEPTTSAIYPATLAALLEITPPAPIADVKPLTAR